MILIPQLSRSRKQNLRSAAMSRLYEELQLMLDQEKGVALATVVRGADHVGAKLLVFPDKTIHGTSGLTTLDHLVIEDAERVIWNGDAQTHTYTVEGAT